jgi:hypothetical protein
MQQQQQRRQVAGATRTAQHLRVQLVLLLALVQMHLPALLLLVAAAMHRSISALHRVASSGCSLAVEVAQQIVATSVQAEASHNLGGCCHCCACSSC